MRSGHSGTGTGGRGFGRATNSASELGPGSGGTFDDLGADDSCRCGASSSGYTTRTRARSGSRSAGCCTS
jgi:hypothetical protein